MQKKMGMKWFYFYCFVKPWLTIITGMMQIPDLVENLDMYIKVPILFNQVLFRGLDMILVLVLFICSLNRGRNVPTRDLFFIRYIRFLIIYEVVFFTYNHVINMLMAFPKKNMQEIIMMTFPIAIVSYLFLYGLPIWIYFTKRFWTKKFDETSFREGC